MQRHEMQARRIEVRVIGAPVNQRVMCRRG
jgi:hypothetical protein